MSARRNSTVKSVEKLTKGKHPFSEPETQGIKTLVESFDICCAMNFHSYGNLWITPYNYLNSEIYYEQMNFQIAKFYSMLKTDFKKDEFNDFGNSQSTIKYVVNGCASDWMLESEGIISMSPELGKGTISTQGFYISKKLIPSTLVMDSKAVEEFMTNAEPLLSMVSYGGLQSVETMTQSFERLYINEENNREIDHLKRKNLGFQSYDFGKDEEREKLMSKETEFEYEYDDAQYGAQTIKPGYEEFKEKFVDLMKLDDSKNTYYLLMQNKGISNLRNIYLMIEAHSKNNFAYDLKKLSMSKINPVIFTKDLPNKEIFEEKTMKLADSEVETVKTSSFTRLTHCKEI